MFTMLLLSVLAGDAQAKVHEKFEPEKASKEDLQEMRVFVARYRRRDGIPLLDHESLGKNQVGKLYYDRLEILQIQNEQEAIVTCDGVPLWLRGVDLSDRVDGDVYENFGLVVRVTGNKQYQTRSGKKTVRAIEPFDLKRLK